MSKRSRWSLWQESKHDRGSPDVSFIDANSRRKLSRFAKMALKVTHDCTFDVPKARFVFASQYGDITRTTKMLSDLANKEELSPMAFSMSVLNSCAGVYSIAKQDCSPTTAISAGISSFGYGLLEASLQFKNNPEAPVIYVYVDEAPPSVCEVQRSELLISRAICILISEKPGINISCQISDADNSSSGLVQSKSFVNCLMDKESCFWEGEGRRWSWNYNEQ